MHRQMLCNGELPIVPRSPDNCNCRRPRIKLDLTSLARTLCRSTGRNLLRVRTTWPVAPCTTMTEFTSFPLIRSGALSRTERTSSAFGTPCAACCSAGRHYCQLHRIRARSHSRTEHVRRPINAVTRSSDRALACRVHWTTTGGDQGDST
jgi:hypothetical protein